MEEYNSSTRFVFTCNESTDIIETIQSRCIIFRYNKLKQDQIESKLMQICKREKVEYTSEGITTIALMSSGDLRQAINKLQFTHNGYTTIIPENVYKLCDDPHPIIIEQIFTLCYKKDFKGALSIFMDLKNKGYSSSDISLSMIETLKNMTSSTIDESTRIKYMSGKACLL
jgi:replication factor C subunit 2/4